MLDKGFGKIDEEKGPGQLSGILSVHVMHANAIDVPSSPQNQKKGSRLKQPTSNVQSNTMSFGERGSVGER